MYLFIIMYIVYMPSDTILYDDNDKLNASSILWICYCEEKLIIEEDLWEGNSKLLFFVEAVGKLQGRNSKFFAWFETMDKICRSYQILVIQNFRHD